MNALVSVLVAEPSEIVCEGLKTIIESTGNYNFLAPVHQLTGLNERLDVIRPDVLILNPVLLSTPLNTDTYMSPRRQLVTLSQARPTMPIVALVYQYVEQSLLHQFDEVIDIAAGRSGLLNVLSSVTQHHADVEVMPSDAKDDYELSERETDVLVLVAKGLSSKEIADTLHISIHTVNSHRKNITAKTGIKSVAGLAVYAMLHNLMD